MPINEPCQCDPPLSGEEHCNGGCELRAALKESDERRLQLAEELKHIRQTEVAAADAFYQDTAAELVETHAALEASEAKVARLAEAVNKQAEDEGLWFIAETAAEAYLQQELRKLHTLIEDAAKE